MHWFSVVSIVKQHKHCVYKEEVIVTLDENRVVRGCVKQKDVDIATKLQLGEGMLHLFLDIPSKLENIINFFPRTKQNSSYHNAATLEKGLKCKRLTRT